VIPTDCPDPGVLRDGSQYVLTCTSGNAADAYPIYTSPDLASWTLAGHVFPAGHWPSWARSDFWAPEIHRVGAGYVVYFSARGADGRLAVGAASAPAATGPFADIGQPLVNDPTFGLIDASEINGPAGVPYVLWKVDGNAVGMPTPIYAQPLAADGLSLTGSPTILITNDQPWEGLVVEGPFMVEHGGKFFLFYSGNSYANATYAVGVAGAPSPLGPFAKAPGPIVATGGAWVGPGHCAVVDTPAGDTALVYHAWRQGCVNAAGCGRLTLVDQVVWGASWPAMPLAPSSTSRPLW
jgi:beta-xylosidase